jgi:hypothetical protein
MAGVGDDVSGRRFQLLQGGVLAVPAEHQSRRALGRGADQEEGVVAGQGFGVFMQLLQGLRAFCGGAERKLAP